MAKKTANQDEAETVLGADGEPVEAWPAINGEGDSLLPGFDPPPPAPELWDVTRTFRVSHDQSRLESEAIEQGRACRHLGKLSVTFTSRESDVAADNAEDAIRIGCGKLDAEVMTEEEFSSCYPGGEVMTTVKAKRVQAAKTS